MSKKVNNNKKTPEIGEFFKSTFFKDTVFVRVSDDLLAISLFKKIPRIKQSEGKIILMGMIVQSKKFDIGHEIGFDEKELKTMEIVKAQF